MESQLVEGTCYRKLTVQSSIPGRTFTIFLAPDQRYITPVPMDVTVDPNIEAKAMRMQISDSLSDEGSPSIGVKNAPVTIVEFSDFQCPYCKRFAMLIDSLPDSEKQKVRLVYKEFPLDMHKWAKRAAELATCAAAQDSAAFWRVHDFFYANQSTISQENIDARFDEFASTSGHINATAVHRCIDDKAGVLAVSKDVLLANKLHISGTPTIFVNGRRIQGVKTVEELSSLIEQGVSMAKSVAGPSVPGGSK